MNKTMNCKTCGTEIAVSAKSCPSCGAKNKPPIYKRVWFWILIVFIVISIIGGIGGSSGTASSTNNLDKTAFSNSSVIPNKNPAFDGDCGITATAKMGSSIIQYPELTISITNTTEKEIAAIQFYVVPYDVYGDEITGWTSQNRIYTNTAIGSGKSDSVSYQFIEQSIKTIKLYVYSVYFSDGTEWGDKDSEESVILSNGTLIEVSGQS